MRASVRLFVAVLAGTAAVAGSAISAAGVQRPLEDARPQSVMRGHKSQGDWLEHVRKAISTMQESYFSPWLGTWDEAIDWTAAVTATHVSAALMILSSNLNSGNSTRSWEDAQWQLNEINLYFDHVLAYYFGQDHFAIRNQAYDDILWVVLGWLETIQFINKHTVTYAPMLQVHDAQDQLWHGNAWIPAFAHRSRIFWELATKGWDQELCGGGMTWNPRLEPYKNAITNELFIAASAAMYRYFPGDNNTSPFLIAGGRAFEVQDLGRDGPFDRLNTSEPHDIDFLLAADIAYDWLAGSNMLNKEGLYIDGFHISGVRNPRHQPKMCDIRNEQVYTYNQGVILSGQINLFKSTQDISYLQDGHDLIRSVIAATGYSLPEQSPVDEVCGEDAHNCNQSFPRWHGLGRAGILEEQCDSRGSCSQDGQTFKGIFFHHLTAFCEPLVDTAEALRRRLLKITIDGRHHTHEEACGEYVDWISRNAEAALKTHDEQGRFGMWWTAGLMPWLSDTVDEHVEIGSGAVDYRNQGVPKDMRWQGVERDFTRAETGGEIHVRELKKASSAEQRDPNSRGRGRTLETQGGGLAVLRCAWQMHHWYD